MNTSSRIVLSLVLLGLGVTAGIYGPKWVSDWWPEAEQPAPTATQAPRAAPRTPVEVALVESAPFALGHTRLDDLG